MLWFFPARAVVFAKILGRLGLLLSVIMSNIAAAALRPVDRIAPPLQAMEIPRLPASVALTIDGQLDEAVWQQVPSQDDFAIIQPDTLLPGRHATELRMFYTADGLYVAFDLHQPPATQVARLSSRDQRDLNRDAVFITLDTSGEGRYGYWFGIALGGSLMDGTVLPERRYTTDWDAPWYGATVQTQQGWSAEMFIPWSAMTMPERSNGRQVGIYAARQVAYLDERWAWPALPESKPQFISVLDRLALHDVRPKQQYSIFPYTSSTVDEVGDATDYKAGADIFWRPASNFQLAATLNPDFGSVESDDVIVNLSATETFFPEKRLFFLEGQSVFVATPRASAASPLTLLNTRRIGGRAAQPDIPVDVNVSATELGQPAELLGALKTTGEYADLRYGFIGAWEDETQFNGVDSNGQAVALTSEGTRYGVGRAHYESVSNGASRSLGWMSTLADHPQRRAQVHAVDAHYLSADGRWQWDGQVMQSTIRSEAMVAQPMPSAIDTSSEQVDRGIGGFVDLRYIPHQNSNHLLEMEHFDDSININDLGYLSRNNISRMRYEYTRRSSNIDFGREASSAWSLLHGKNGEGYLVWSGLFWDASVTRDNYSAWRLGAAFMPARYEDLESFGNGTFATEHRPRLYLGYSTDSTRRLTGSVDVRYEGEISGGHWLRTELALTYNPMDRLTTEVAVTHRKREGWLLHQQDKEMTSFNAEEWKYQWDVDFFFTARQQFRASLQWVGIRAFEDEFYRIPENPGDLLPRTKTVGAASDHFSVSNLSFQLRYRWELAPMSDMFVVYTKNGKQAGELARDYQSMFTDTYHEPRAEQLVVKLRYRLGN